MLSYIICFTLNKIGQDSSQHLLINLYVKVNAIPVTGRGSPLGCETSRLPHFLDNLLTHGRKVVSLMRRPPFTHQEDSWYSFLLEAEWIPEP
jgi:hypothetical protein